MDAIKPLYDYILQFISTYILPTETAIPYYDYFLIGLSVLVSLAIAWAFFLRPFWWLFKYGIWGGSKKHRRRNDDD